MKAANLNYQDANGVRLVTRFVLVQQADKQWLLLCEVPRLREPAPEDAQPQASLMTSIPALISYICSVYHLQPAQLIVVTSYVPVEQVAHCSEAQLMKIEWEDCRVTLFGLEVVGLHWHHAGAQQLQQWQRLAAA